MRVCYRQAASDDMVRQFRYYLVALNLPEIAVRFREAVRRTVESLREHPFVGPRYGSSSPQLRNLRSWPVAGLRPSAFITFWTKTPSTSFASCTAGAMLNASLGVRRAPDWLAYATDENPLWVAAMMRGRRRFRVMACGRPAIGLTATFRPSRPRFA